ncbi:hypothetical protein EBB59_13285 [Lysobacter pythonis]|uniref:Relaxation protein n=1 Tax=Solilutibacter pythonis TaxID=2483112 RepID=A0A3M2HFQ9_9GAMM|nr:hypothetical protein [Lysobacter pythonis]RMH87275.1 hypothetical protein EBB59_13285 [Lysobacter pythonis]
MNRQDEVTLAALMAALETSNTTLQETLKSMAGLMALMKQREQGLRDIINEQLQVLHATVNRADHKVNRVVEDALPRLTRLTERALESTLAPAAERLDRQLANADKTLHQASHRYAQAQQSLESTVVWRMRMTAMALLAAGLIALCGGGYSLYNAQAALAESTKRKQEIAYLDRIARADLAACGTDRLCARIDEKAPRHGNKKEYRTIALRR